MTSSQTRGSTLPSQEVTYYSKRKTIHSNEVGVALAISDRDSKDLERIQKNTVAAAQGAQEFYWQ